MNKSINDKQTPQGSYFFLAVALLSGAALIFSLLSLYDHTAIQHVGSSSALCNISEGISCDLVNQSSWSYILGIPIASLGIFFYGLLLLLSFFSYQQKYLTYETAKSIILVFSTFAVFFSLYLFFVSKFIIGSLCLYCLSMYFINFLLFALSAFSDRSCSFIRRIGKGLNAFKDYAFTLAGAGNYKSSMGVARYSFVAIISLALFSFFLPELFLSRMDLPETNRASEDAAHEAVFAWTQQEQQSIGFQNTGAFRDYSKGKEDAPIQLVKFSDYQCPGCRQLYFTLEELEEEYKDELHLVFRNFPLDNSCNPLIQHQHHLHACYIAKFTRCAGEQGFFFKAVDFIYSLDGINNRDIAATRAEINETVSMFQLDDAAIQECLESERHIEKIVADVMEADRLDLQGTPTVWVNGKRVLNPTSENLRKIFDYVLAAN